MKESGSCCQTQTDSTDARQSHGEPRQKRFVPSFDVWKSDDRIVLRGDVPGVKPEDLEIRFENGSLHVHGKVLQRGPSKGVLRREYSVGDFERRFAVSDDIDADAIRANLRDGVVEIDLPFAAKEQPRKIEIQTA